LYIQLAVSLGLRLITADGRLQDVPAADVVVA
jgi:predicted nucleic acid-binding protein